jgi:hypothetical protein
MKCALIACALLLSGTFAAQAYHSDDTYYDLVRPNGQPRSDAIFDADLNFCYAQTGANRYGLGDTPAFKQCMLGRKWRWESTRIIGSPSRGSGSGGAPDTSGPSSDPSPSPDPSSAGPDMSGMNTPTNPTWSGLDQ